MNSLASSASSGVTATTSGAIAAEQRHGLFHSFRRRAADDLRHLGQFLDAVALHDALRAEGDFVLAAELRQIGVQPVGGARENRRAQDQQLVVGHMRQQVVDAALHGGGHRIEKFVNRRPDGDDDRAGAAKSGLATT